MEAVIEHTFVLEIGFFMNDRDQFILLVSLVIGITWLLLLIIKKPPKDSDNDLFLKLDLWKEILDEMIEERFKSESGSEEAKATNDEAKNKNVKRE